MTVELRGVPTVNLAGFLRALRHGPQNPRVVELAKAIEIELRIRALAALTPGIGRTHGAAFVSRGAAATRAEVQAGGTTSRSDAR